MIKNRIKESMDRFYEPFSEIDECKVLTDVLLIRPEVSVDAAAQNHSTFAAPNKVREALPPFGSHDVLAGTDDSSARNQVTFRRWIDSDPTFAS